MGGGGRGEQEAEGKVYGKRSGGPQVVKAKSETSAHGDVTGCRANMDAINYWRYNSGPCLQTLPSY